MYAVGASRASTDTAGKRKKNGSLRVQQGSWTFNCCLEHDRPLYTFLYDVSQTDIYGYNPRVSATGDQLGGKSSSLVPQNPSPIPTTNSNTPPFIKNSCVIQLLV